MKKSLLFLLLLPFAAAQAAPVDDMRTVVETIRGKVTTNEQLVRIATAFSEHWVNEFNGLVADPENPTNNEKAAFYLMKMRQYTRSIVVNAAEEQARPAANITVQTAGEAAAADVD